MHLSLKYILSLAFIPLSLLGAIATPITQTGEVHGHLNQRTPVWNWPRCTFAEEGQCTLYMATGKPYPTFTQYRTFALFDHKCKLTSLYYTDVKEKIVNLKGHLPGGIRIAVDDQMQPEGAISYRLADTPLGSGLECHDWGEYVDGIGCRRHFRC
jgi:hypothetical protein